MSLVATRFEGYFIDSITHEVFSNKRGKMYKLKQSFVKDTRKINPKRYIQVGVKGCNLLHRLIADTFIKCVDGLTVNHINGDTLDNSLSNLEVITIEENQKHAKDFGLLAKGETHGKAKYSDELLTAALKEIKSGCSVNSTAKKYGITQSYLNKVKNKVYRSDLHAQVFQEKL